MARKPLAQCSIERIFCRPLAAHAASSQFTDIGDNVPTQSSSLIPTSSFHPLFDLS